MNAKDRAFKKTGSGNTWPFGHPTERCGRCEGTGAEPGAAKSAMTAQFGTPIETCRKCDGRGRVIAVRQEPRP